MVTSTGVCANDQRQLCNAQHTVGSALCHYDNNSSFSRALSVVFGDSGR